MPYPQRQAPALTYRSMQGCRSLTARGGEWAAAVLVWKLTARSHADAGLPWLRDCER